MTDIELLELAAKAAEIAIMPCGCRNEKWPFKHDEAISGKWGHWNPLTDDGDALRLAVKLKIPMQFPDWANITRTWGSKSNPDAFDEPHNDDPYAATRRAIVRAAAEIGKAMP